MQRIYIGLLGGGPVEGLSGDPKGYGSLPSWTLTNFVSSPAFLSGHLFTALPINPYLLKCFFECLFIFERESVREREGEAESGREREAQSPKQAPD